MTLICWVCGTHLSAETAEELTEKIKVNNWEQINTPDNRIAWYCSKDSPTQFKDESEFIKHLREMDKK